MALAAKADGAPWRVFSVHGDGELQEGSIWEAAMSASHYNLDNLIAIVDRNYCQIDGRTSSVMEIEPLAQKWEAFGWDVKHCNGNSIEELVEVLEFPATKGKPRVIIAKTLMGQGVASITDDYRWHGKAPSVQEAAQFIAEINSYYTE